jgi:Leucine-rich repeat (LRR) protein
MAEPTPTPTPTSTKKYFIKNLSVAGTDSYVPDQTGLIELPPMQNGGSSFIIPKNSVLVFKRGTTTPDDIEPTDLVHGVIGDYEIEGIYLGGNFLDLESYDILEKTYLIDPSILRLSFENIDSTVAFLGIADKNNISNWNTYFQSHNMFSFDSVVINENIAEFYKNAEGISDTMLYLVNMQIKYFDTVKFNNILRVILSSNNITLLGNLPPNTEELYLNNNNITEFIFENTLPESLKVLNLRVNQLTSFDTSTVPRGLVQLMLEVNYIPSIDFSSLPSERFESLNLVQNSITSVDVINLPQTLKELLIAGNQIPEFDFSVPLPPSLETLLLSDNLLTVFDPTLPLPSTLKVLGLNTNQITVFDPTLPLPSGLEQLSVGDNLLTIFDPTLPLPSTLMYLEVGKNNLGVFNPTLPLPNSLLQLNLIMSGLTVFNPSDSVLTNLKYLTLSNNQLTEFNPSTVDLSTLEALYLTNNQLTEFNPTDPLTNLQFLYLDINHITFDSWNNSIEWIDSITKTGYLYAYNNADGTIGSNTRILLQAKGWNVY